MVRATKSSRKAASVTSLRHPLDPLTAEEIVDAVAILRAERSLGKRVRFETVVLQEPEKDVVLSFRAGEPIRREAFIILLDPDAGATYEAVVSLTDRAVTSWKHIPGAQPRIMMDEFFEFEAALKANPEFQAVMRKRGITNLDLVMVDPWPAGNFGKEEEKGRRLVVGRCFLRSSPHDNGYARPIEGVGIVFDLNRMEVLKLEDYGVVPLPPNPGNYATEFITESRNGLKPLEIAQSEGPSFEVRGNEVRWQKWSLRVGFTPREGLILYTIGYEDKGRVRPIIYRACLSEMVVPYGDPSGDHYRKNAFDVGEAGVGVLANSLELGCDCLGTIHYFDAVLNDSKGGARAIPKAICMHEEDYGILWKHTDFRTGLAEVRRSRRLVISFIATLGNYEYGFFWYFYQDGTIEYQVKLTGIVNTAAVAPGVVPKYGSLVAPGLNAHIHQHFFNVRLDMSVDGLNNSVYEMNTVAEPLGPANPYGNAHFAQRTLLATESEAQRTISPLTGRYWVIANPSVQNALGQAVGYKLMPGENVLPFAHPSASVIKRAGFMTKHLWVTPYDPDEKAAAGDYANQHPGGAGLPDWTRANRSIDNTNVVVWYTFGHHHVPRPEDWPVMPVMYVGFALKPVGFFDMNPAMDVPPPMNHNGSCHA